MPRRGTTHLRNNPAFEPASGLLFVDHFPGRGECWLRARPHPIQLRRQRRPLPLPLPRPPKISVLLPQPAPSGRPMTTRVRDLCLPEEVEEVVLHATVVDDKNRIITDLERNAFTVFENGKPQTITSFRHEDIPVAMGIVIDNSGSMREKRDKVNKAALNLVRVEQSPGPGLRREFQRRILSRSGFHQRHRQTEAGAGESRSPRRYRAIRRPGSLGRSPEEERQSCRRRYCSSSPTAKTTPARRTLEQAVRTCRPKTGPPSTP